MSASGYSQRSSLYKATKYKVGFVKFALRSVEIEKYQTLDFFLKFREKWAYLNGGFGGIQDVLK